MQSVAARGRPDVGGPQAGREAGWARAWLPRATPPLGPKTPWGPTSLATYLLPPSGPLLCGLP